MPKITKRAVDALRPDARRDVFLWDSELKGFGVRMKPSGAATYFIQYRNADGRTRRLKVGRVGANTPEEAREAAREGLAAVHRGEDPAAAREAERRAVTVEQLCRQYLAAAERGLIMGKRGRPKKPSTLLTDRGRIERHILPLLGRRKVKDLTTPDVVRFMRDVTVGKTRCDVRTGVRGRAIVEGGAGTAARTVGLLGGILSYAVSEGIIPRNPVHGVKRPADGRRNIRLSGEQYHALGEALAAAEADGVNPVAVTAVRLLALTGCRRGEIERLRWADVDLAGRCLRLSDSKEGSSIRPLGDPALAILRELPRSGEFVLSGRSPEKPFVGLPKLWPQIVARAGLPDLTPHGLRHAFASVAHDLGYSEPTIAALLGHATGGITRRYIHALDGALIAAADRVARTIDQHMSGVHVGTVVTLRPAG